MRAVVPGVLSLQGSECGDWAAPVLIYLVKYPSAGSRLCVYFLCLHLGTDVQLSRSIFGANQSTPLPYWVCCFNSHFVFDPNSLIESLYWGKTVIPGWRGGSEAGGPLWLCKELGLHSQSLPHPHLNITNKYIEGGRRKIKKKRPITVIFNLVNDFLKYIQEVCIGVLQENFFFF